jgi:hypothetical protein
MVSIVTSTKCAPAIPKFTCQPQAPSCTHEVVLLDAVYEVRRPWKWTFALAFSRRFAPSEHRLRDEAIQSSFALPRFHPPQTWLHHLLHLLLLHLLHLLRLLHLHTLYCLRLR